MNRYNVTASNNMMMNMCYMCGRHMVTFACKCRDVHDGIRG
ncbi:MAG: hypothetical protein RR364_05145 [Lachnospiraceae bacterium]